MAVFVGAQVEFGGCEEVPDGLAGEGEGGAQLEVEGECWVWGGPVVICWEGISNFGLLDWDQIIG